MGIETIGSNTEEITKDLEIAQLIVSEHSEDYKKFVDYRESRDVYRDMGVRFFILNIIESQVPDFRDKFKMSQEWIVGLATEDLLTEQNILRSSQMFNDILDTHKAMNHRINRIIRSVNSELKMSDIEDTPAL